MDNVTGWSSSRLQYKLELNIVILMGVSDWLKYTSIFMLF